MSVPYDFQKVPIPPPWLHDTLLLVTSKIAPLVLKFEEKLIAIGRHPLQSLFHLVEKTLQTEEGPDQLEKAMQDLPESIKKQMFFEIRSSHREGKETFDLKNLFSIIKKVVYKNLEFLPEGKKGEFDRTFTGLIKPPPEGGERDAHIDTIALIRALHRHHCLGCSGKKIYVYTNLEKKLPQPSCIYHLGRKELKRGQIGYHNGIGCSLQDAKWNAEQISDASALGYNLHCTYSATINFSWDIASAAIGQCGILTPPVEKLLDQWQDFFERDDSNRLLQICHSRGAIEVNNALGQLPFDLQQRIIAIAVGPACFIPSNKAYRVVNLVIPKDPIVKIASNRHLMHSPHTLKLEPHCDHPDPHYPHGASFRDHLTPMIDCYIRTNDIF